MGLKKLHAMISRIVLLLAFLSLPFAWFGIVEFRTHRKINTIDMDAIKKEAIYLSSIDKGNFRIIPLSESTPHLYDIDDSVNYSKYGVSVTIRNGIVVDTVGLLVNIGEENMSEYHTDVEVEIYDGIYHWINSN